MCGIVYAKSNQPVNQFVHEQFEAQKRRGLQGFGFFAPQDARLVHNQREHRIINQLNRIPHTEILFHHRMPTSTPNVRSSCHPFTTQGFFEHEFVVVHNGMISNASALKAAHELQGITYVSELKNGKFNDSEALTWALGRYLSGHDTELDVHGSVAFIVSELKDGKPLFTHFGRKYYEDLWFYWSKADDELVVASELERHGLIEKNLLRECESGQLYTYSHAKHQLFKTPLKFKTFNSNTYHRRALPARTEDPEDDLKRLVGNYPQYELEYYDWGLATKELNEEARLIFADIPRSMMRIVIAAEIKLLRSTANELRQKAKMKEAKKLHQRVAVLGHLRKKIIKKGALTDAELNTLLTEAWEASQGK